MRRMRRRNGFISVDKEQLIITSIQPPGVDLVAFGVLFLFDIQPIFPVVIKSDKVAGALPCHEKFERVFRITNFKFVYGPTSHL